MMLGVIKASRAGAAAAGLNQPVAIDQQISSSDVDTTTSVAEDRALIARIRAGDKDAYRRLVEKYQKRAFHLAFEIVRSREDAEDVVQESFVKAYLSLRDFKQDAAFYTWLYRIVYNMAVDYRRKIARRGGPTLEFDERMLQGAEPRSEERPAANVLENRIEGPQEALLRKEREQRLRAALSEISEEHRLAITLREVDGLSYDEIADVMGVAKGTVMSRLHYARKKIQAAFEKE